MRALKLSLVLLPLFFLLLLLPSIPALQHQQSILLPLSSKKEETPATPATPPLLPPSASPYPSPPSFAQPPPPSPPPFPPPPVPLVKLTSPDVAFRQSDHPEWINLRKRGKDEIKGGGEDQEEARVVEKDEAGKETDEQREEDEREKGRQEKPGLSPEEQVAFIEGEEEGGEGEGSYPWPPVQPSPLEEVHILIPILILSSS